MPRRRRNAVRNATRWTRIGASISIASAGRFMQFVASVSITSTPSRPALAPLPPAISSPTT